MSICVDSSFLVSKYILDPHSEEADQRMEQRPLVWVTPLNRSEVANAVYRYVYRKALAQTAADAVWADFESDFANRVWIEVGLPTRLWEASIGLARRYGPTLGVRTLDSLHVACALELNAERFWTFDARQERLAQAVGLNTES